MATAPEATADCSPTTGSAPAGARPTGLRDGAGDAPDERASASSRPASAARAATARCVIDAAAEDAVFAELERLHADGARFTAVSEERGDVDFGDPGRARRHRPDRRLA